eukprot:TRINITY_DN64422_c0_g1_i1.p1 TRINITY_DN64422_c0_g1~~TRINITY_DN64422_c0_g1_i1.p1  ORF type:complete len:237 (-),score=49.27 TRINITY_DN64422_c0_g1_i1:7-717(-)
MSLQFVVLTVGLATQMLSMMAHAEANEPDTLISEALDREVRSLQKLQAIDAEVAERARSQTRKAETFRTDTPQASEDGQVGAAWIAKALLEAENAELRRQVASHRQLETIVEQRHEEPASLLSQSSSMSSQQGVSANAQQEAQSRVVVVNLLRGTMVIVAVAVLGMCWCGAMQSKSHDSSSKAHFAQLQANAQRYGSMPAPVRTKAPAGIVDEDEEQLQWLPRPQTRQPEEVWIRT